MKLSKHLTLEIATKSATAKRLGISNNPDQSQLDNLVEYGFNIYDQIIDHFKVIPVTHTIFRCPKLNTAIKGDLYSQHMRGQAGDHDFDNIVGISNSDLFYFVIQNLTFDRCIFEYGTEHEPKWVHISYNKKGNRRQLGLKVEGHQYVYFTNVFDFEDAKRQLYATY